MKLDNKPKHLTKLFYDKYGSYKEILNKEKRQYCIALLTVDDITFSIPFRTNINHKYSYIFKNSPRSEKSGLDFTKAVVITETNFIGEDTLIDDNYSSFYAKY